VVWVTGRVFDRDTRQPVLAYIEYSVFEDNPHRKDWPGFRPDATLTNRLDNGCFRLVAFPGRGVVGVKVDRWSRPDLDRYVLGTNGQGPAALPTKPFPVHTGEFNTHVIINPHADDRELSVDIALDPGRTVVGRIIGPDGKPAGCVLVAGENPGNIFKEETRDGGFRAIGMRSGQPRFIQAIDVERGLAGAVSIHGDEKEPVELKLQPWGSVRGRLIDEAGKPLAGVRLISFHYGNTPEELFKIRAGFWPEMSDIRTDNQGNFCMTGLVPGMRYSVAHLDGRTLQGYVFHELSVTSGEKKDLGEIGLK
jgi:hypothetical protein